MTERLRFRLALPIVAGLLFAAPAAAQGPVTPADETLRTAVAPSLAPREAPAPAAVEVTDAPRTRGAEGPTLEGLRAGVRAPVARDETRVPAAITAQRSGLSQSEVLMIVGGAAFLAGAVIGGDAGTLIMIGGAGIGLWGLYLYLQ